MTLTRTIEEIGEAYVAGADKAARKYSAGIDASDPWQAPTKASANFWHEQVSKSETKTKFIAGVDAVSDEDWRRLAKTKGSANIKNGMIAGKDKYKENYGPVYSAVLAAAKSLPPRTASVSDNIEKRLKPVLVAAMNAAPKRKGLTTVTTSTL